ncbi:kinase-like domain-containing protein [Gigaspora rosea]|uniref:Kinase-like domain-containing protein n=1 Tax=Gigaspora rosea TaxID=44941 RepID=A0A397ULT0_9GLOM|nr:kinase-like domain-containing protein [Gigaspora rosea]
MDYSEDTIEWQVIGSTQQENSFNYSEQLNEILKKLNIKRLDHSQFRQRDYLGRGAYAEVYSGLYQEKEYAFKCLKDKLRLEDKKVKKFFKYMSRELELLSEVNHPNVVEFYGILQNPNTDNITFVLQLANDGNLRDYLKKKRQNGIFKILWSELIQIAKDLTHGLEHLHSKKIIHRDLHSKNVLIDRGKALITDFGLSKHLNNSLSSEVGGMLAYREPQSFKPIKYARDEKSDIYSLGVLFWELTSGNPPFSNYANDLAMAIEISRGGREKMIPDTPPNYASLYRNCWSDEPGQRPTLNEILDELKILSEETIEFFTNDFNNGAEVQRDESDEFSEQFSELFLSELDRPNDPITCEERQTFLIQNLENMKIKIRFDYSKFSEVQEIGYGGFSTVYSASFQGKKYALKSLKKSLYAYDESFFKQIRREINLLYQTNHSNIIKLYGFSIDSHSNFMTVMQLANDGDLRVYLRRKKIGDLYKIHWNEILTIAKGITYGINYLHNNNIIHRDLNSKNILIDHGRALISDFGVSKNLNSTISSTSMYGMVAYFDPHCIKHGIKKNKASDIYSFGVILWELTSGAPPFEDEPIHKIITEITSNGMREMPIDNTPVDYINLYCECWSDDPNNRPTLESILNKLENLSGVSAEFIENNFKIKSIKKKY